nr:MAG TPA: hypothetical protein [Caudoviricetes sp.]
MRLSYIHTPQFNRIFMNYQTLKCLIFYYL